MDRLFSSQITRHALPLSACPIPPWNNQSWRFFDSPPAVESARVPQPPSKAIMFKLLVLTTLLQALGTLGIPNPLQDDAVSSTVTVTVHNATSTSYTTLITGEATAYAPNTPTLAPSDFTAVSRPGPTFTAIAVRTGSPLHLQPINAVRQRFFIGPQIRTFCPETVEQYDACPPGDVTAFTLCSMVSNLHGPNESTSPHG